MHIHVYVLYKHFILPLICLSIHDTDFHMSKSCQTFFVMTQLHKKVTPARIKICSKSKQLQIGKYNFYISIIEKSVQKKKAVLSHKTVSQSLQKGIAKYII